MDGSSDQPRTVRVQDVYEFAFPSGGSVVMGERADPDGPTLYLSMMAAGTNQPSLSFWIDPVSFQPMLTFLSGPDGLRTVPLDKLIGSLRNAGAGSLLSGR